MTEQFKSKSKILDAIARLFQDKQPVQVEMTKMQLWQIICTIQLACRHPHFQGPTRVEVEGFARQMGNILSANDRDLKMLLEMGWDPKYDEVHHDKG